MTLKSGHSLTLPKFSSKCIIVEQVKSELRPDTVVEKGIVIHPCTTERGKIMVDTRFSSGELGQVEKFFDFSSLCSILDAYKDRFQETKCSPSLGIARVEWKGKAISIFRNGRVKIRRVVDEEDAKRTVKFLASVLWGSVICGNCGKASVFCASGGCGDCIERGRRRGVKVEVLLAGVMIVEGYRHLMRAFEGISEILDRIAKSIKGRRSYARSLTEGKEVDASISRASHLAIDFIVQTPGRDDAVFGLTLLGAAFNLRGMRRALAELAETLKDVDFSTIKGDILDRFYKALGIVLEFSRDAITAYVKGDRELGKKARSGHEEFSRLMDGVRKSIKRIPRRHAAVINRLVDSIDVFAANGFYTARIM